MSLKHGVLGLVIERRGYGYELVQRFEQRLGPGWQLNSGAVYIALDQLARDELVQPAAGLTRGRTTDRGAPRLTYEATAAGVEEFEAWMRRPVGSQPVRDEIHVRLALSRPGDVPSLIDLTLQQERECLQRIQAHAANPEFERMIADGEPWADITSIMVRDAEVAALAATVDWLRRVRESLQRVAEQQQQQQAAG